ncbi:zinc-ribbon domain-containing protein [Clostridium sp. AM33-3]|uniref:zinc-ribbon domain-containing protein n=1 Tax=Clostridium sp. AM33-3 TaxID=2292304 RepID=UPI000E4D6361|nr:zinc-ribbon domain-containing protein [Clostridium sp. AM33-3]RHT24636.1 zinc-ribbon domain-containing protein [Clostridium sp. AM33-3]
MVFCAKCGKKLNEGARFCPRCGTPVGEQGARVLPFRNQEAAVPVRFPGIRQVRCVI